MKYRTQIQVACLGAACSLLLVTGGQAQEKSERRAYFNVGAGVAWADKVKVKELPVLGPQVGLQAKFDTGYRFDVSGGYRLNKWIAGEIETGLAYNSIKSIGGGAVDGSVANIPLTANLVFRYPNSSHWEPYVGGGAGMSFSLLTLDNVSYAIPGGTFTLDGTSSDAVFAYQGFAGVRYNFNERMSLGAYYKLLGTGNTSWDVAGAAGRIRSEGLVTHTVGVAFTLRF